MSRFRTLAVIFLVFILFVLVIVYIAVGSNSSKSGIAQQNLSEVSRLDLGRLSFCEVAKQSRVPASMIAGVVLAEKQLNRDWTDSIQDGLFTIAYYLLNDTWWQVWSQRSLALASAEVEIRSVKPEWSREVAFTGIIFSIGPSQITPRTALSACKVTNSTHEWCQGTRPLIRALLSESQSLEVVALILDVERQSHLKVTGIDVQGDPGKWAMLYNFGGDIFRTKFKDNLDRPANTFGRWIQSNLNDINKTLGCSN